MAKVDKPAEKTKVDGFLQGPALVASGLGQGREGYFRFSLATTR